MNKVIKIGIGAIGLFLALVVAAVVIVPMVVDVKQYKPEIEALVTEQTGRSFSMGDDISLSVFPWVGVRLTDVVLGSGQGFKAKDMVSVKSFEVRLKVMPLLSKQVEVDSFTLDSPAIYLEKDKKGRANWEGLGSSDQTEGKASEKKQAPQSPGQGDLPIASLMVGKFAIVNGMLSYENAGSGYTRTLSDLNLELKDISFDKPVTFDISALVDGKPLSLKGNAGPLGQNPGKADMDLALTLKALDEIALEVKGRLLLAGNSPGLDGEFKLDTFSPKAVFEKLGQVFPVQTTDPKVLEKLSVAAKVKASGSALSITDGVMVLDDSTLKFSSQVKAFEKPDIQFDLNLDQIDLDRYLPPAGEGNAQASSTADAGKAKPGKTDYAPLRKMILDGKATIGTLKAANLTMTNIKVVVTGKNGIFNLDPFSMDLYEGSSLVKANVDVRSNTPATSVSLTTKGVQAGPLVRDGAQKDIIEGTLAADLNLKMKGETPDQIKQSLGGKGVMTFMDGAIVGIDIAGTIRNAAAGLGVGEKPAEKPKTDFAELKIPYQADKGLVSITGASLTSPLLRLLAQGNTHLVTEELDFRIEPKLVATLKGQGDTKDRSGLLIPLLVTGTWNDPKVRPDLKGMVKDQLSDPNKIKELIDGKSATGEPVSTEDKAKGLLKGFIK